MWPFKEQPQIGQVWARIDHDPFPPRFIVDIVNLRRGYVQYRYRDGTTNSCRVREFIQMYIRHIPDRVAELRGEVGK